MRNIKLLLRITACAFLICGCQKMVPVSTEYEIKELLAGFSTQKSSIDSQSGSANWDVHDSISVIANGQNVKFTSSGEEPSPTATFYGVLKISEGEPVYGLLPYTKDAYYNDGVVTELPSTQIAIPNGISKDAFIYISTITQNTDNILFQNVCGGLRFKVKDKGITSVVFRGNNREILAGSIRVSCKDNQPYIIDVTNPGYEVTLVSESGLQKDTWYYISMLPTVLENGFTLVLKKDDGEMTYQSTKRVEIKRAVYGQITQADKGLLFDVDWKQCGFVHNSLLQLFPNCFWPSLYIQEEYEIYQDNVGTVDGNLEVAQIHLNKDEYIKESDCFIGYFNIMDIPFDIIDYRQYYRKYMISDYPPISETWRKTSELYGTVSGIAIDSKIENGGADIHLTLYFKEADEFKLVGMIEEDNVNYYIYNDNSGYLGAWPHEASGIVRHYLTNPLGDTITVSAENTEKYKSYNYVISDRYKQNNLRILFYVLRRYGDREVDSNGNYGEWYVDNAFSAPIGKCRKLRSIMNIDSSLSDLCDGGTVTID